MCFSYSLYGCFAVVLPSEWLFFKSYILLPTLGTIVAGLIKQMRYEEKQHNSFRQWKVSKIRQSTWLALCSGVATIFGLLVYFAFTNNLHTSLKLLFINLCLFSAYLFGKELANILSKSYVVDVQIYNRRAVGKNRFGQIVFDANLSQSTFRMEGTAVPGVYKGVLETEKQRFAISPDFVGFDTLIEVLQTHMNWGKNRKSQTHRKPARELYESR